MPPTTQSGSQVIAPSGVNITSALGGQTSSQFNTKYGLGTSPTVVSDANIRESTIPNNISSANGYTNPQGASSNSNGGNNTNTVGNSSSGNGTDYSNMSYGDIYKSVLGDQNGQPVDPVIQSELDLIKGQSQNSDAVTASQIAAIQGQYQSRYADTVAQQKGTTAGIEQSLNLGGSSRYAPVSSSGILSSKEKYDLQTLNDLQASENTQIASLKQAQVQNDYKAMSDQLALLDKTRSDKIALATKISDNMAATNKDTRDRLQSAITDASKTALQNGAPKSVIDAINSAKTTSDAYSAASGYGGGNNIDIEKITNTDGSQSIVRVDKNTGKVVGTTNLGGGTPVGSGSSLSPNDYKDFITGLTPEGISNFNKLTPGDQSNVKQLINGDALLSDLFTSKGAAGATLRQQALQKAQSVDPSFSENTNKERYKFMTQWNDPNAKIGMTRNSINTALGHLADVKELTSALSPSDFQIVNNTKNWWNAETGNPDITNLQFGLGQLATEIATVYKGSAPSTEEINSEKAVLGTQLSASQFKGVLDTAAKFLSSKITSSRYQYQTTMGKPLTSSIIDPDKRQALIDAGIDPNVIAKENIPGQPKTGVAGQIDTALGSTNPTTGQKYTPEDIIGHLQTDPAYGDKVKAAINAGWKAQDILNYLSQ